MRFASHAVNQRRHEATYEKEVKKSTEEYLLSLLLKSDLDTIGLYVYKLGAHNFVSDRNRQIFATLKKYIDSKPDKFDIKYFTGTLDGDYGESATEMYLWDFGETSSSPALLAKEIEATISRLKMETTKRELKNLTEQLKLAEMEKDTKKVKELTEEFKHLSEKLV